MSTDTNAPVSGRKRLLPAGRQKENRLQLVEEARNLCEHLLHVRDQDVSALVSSLQPFERDDPKPTASDPEYLALSKAFREVYDKAVLVVDPYTLRRVLGGNSPYKRTYNILSALALIPLGVFLVVLTIYYSAWIDRSLYSLKQADDFIQFDNRGAVRKLVDLEGAFAAKSDDAGATDLGSLELYLDGKAMLRAQYARENFLPNELRLRIREADPVSGPVRQAKEMVHSRICEGMMKDSIIANWLGCSAPASLNPPPSRTAALGAANASEAAVVLASTDSDRPVNVLDREAKSVEARETEVMVMTGRDKRQTDYVYTQFAMQQLSDLLQRKISSVSRLWLPIIYGALGSIVYCGWRLLSSEVAPLRLDYALLRTAFAALAALTLSMLFIPANVFSIGTQVSNPLVYLIAFVLGYSIETFVRTLNRLNVLANRKLSPVADDVKAQL
ncbi:MAG: hypothetical protein ACK5IP_16720 [Paracoccus sp. (in: a-proteobacteria)]